jgi:hypothetical protein
MSDSLFDSIKTRLSAVRANLENTLMPLWQAALSRPIHNSSCGCAVPAAVRLDPETLELDLIDYVAEKHQLERLPEWRDAVSLRARARSNSFPDWLQSLGNGCLEVSLHLKVMADVSNTLRSMAEHAAGRLAPVEALKPGWLGRGAI